MSFILHILRRSIFLPATPATGPDNASHELSLSSKRIVRGTLAALLLAGILASAYGIAGPMGQNSAMALELPDTNYEVPANALFVAPTGDDAATGMQEAPLKTVGMAVQKAVTGTTIVLRGGTYYDVALGGITKQLTLQPFPHEQVWIKGSTPVTDWVSDGSMWRHDGWTTQFCQTCFNQQAIDPASPNAGLPDQVFVNDTPLKQVTSKAEVTPGRFYVDQANQALYVGSDPSTRLVEASTQWRALQFNQGAEGSVVRGIGFAQYAPYWNETQLAAVISNAANVTFERDTFTQSAGTSLGIFQPNNTLRDNVISDNGYRGAVLNKAHNALIEGNTVERNNTEGFNVDSCGIVCTVGGIKAAHSDQITVADNYFRDNNSTGFWCDLGCTNATVVRNVVSGNKNNGLYYEVSSKAIIASNLITGNGRGLKLAGSDHVQIYNNSFVRNKTNLGIYDDGRLATSDSYSAGLGLTWDTTDTELRNNLLANNDDSTSAFYDSNAQQVAAPQMISAMDHNSWYRTSATTPATLIQWCTAPSSCTSYATLAAFAAATGLDTAPTSTATDDTVTHPFFVDETGGDYNLSNTSKAIKAGAPLPQSIANAIGVATSSPPNLGALIWPGKQATTPSVSLTAPTASTVAGANVVLAADAADSSDISTVTFKINDTTLGVDSAAPYTANWDTTKLTNGMYTITAIATNTAGRTATVTKQVNVNNAPPVPVTLNFIPTDDATVSQSAPTAKYGTAPTLTTGEKTRRDFLMKFTVSGLNGRKISAANLKLYTTEAAAAGTSFYGARHNNWTQAAVTWNLAPGINQPALATLSALKPKTSYTVNLARLIKGDGIYSIRVALPNADVASFSSRDSTANKPLLTIVAQ